MTVFETMHDKTKAKAWEFWLESRKRNSSGTCKDINERVARRQFERYLDRNYD